MPGTASAIGRGGGSATGTVTDSRDGRTSAFINALAIATVGGSTLSSYAGMSTDGVNYYVAGSLGGRGGSSYGRGGGASSNEARPGMLIVKCNVAAVSHNADKNGKYGNDYFYVFLGVGAIDYNPTAKTAYVLF